MATGIVNPGEQFNNWTVISFVKKDDKHRQIFKCRCICGVVREVRKGNLGVVTGCGCQRKTYNARNPKKVSLNKKNKTKVTNGQTIKAPVTNQENKTKYAAPTKTARQRIAERIEEQQLAREFNTFE